MFPILVKFVKIEKTQDLYSIWIFAPNQWISITGEGNPYNLSKISSYNGSEFLKVWNGDTCNRVQGSDGSTFNPYIQTEERLWFFNDQLCRSLPLVFDREVKSGELPGYRFVPDENVFKLDFEKYPENSCFCKDEELCQMIGDGMFAVSKCQFNAPIILSWPHFLHANQTFFENVKGNYFITPSQTIMPFGSKSKEYLDFHAK